MATDSLLERIGLVLVGGRRDDTLTGGSGNDAISGNDGNDTLSGLGGNDRIFGGDGNDKLLGGAGNDTLHGGAGNDIISGDAGDDTIDAGDGNDVINWRAGDGSDVVAGGSGRDTFNLTTSDSASQTIHIDAGSNGKIIVTVSGVGGGVVTLNSIEDLNLNVGAGASIVVGNGVAIGPLDVAGNSSANVIDLSGSMVSVNIDAGAGDDTVTGSRVADTIRAGDGNDQIAGGKGADSIDAGAGNDHVVWSTGDGNDVIDGGTGVDQLDVSLVGTGTSTLGISKDAAGRVIFTSSDGAHFTADNVEEIAINAAPGGSTVTVGNLAGTDVSQNSVHFTGGAGNDVLDATATDRRIDAHGNDGSDTLRGGSGNDALDGGNGNDTLLGGAGNDSLVGGAGNDVLDGGIGNDTLDAGSGIDIVRGGDGDDQIAWTLGDDNDGAGSDSVDGGIGADTLSISLAPLPSGGSLTIAAQVGGSVSVAVAGTAVAETLSVTNVENLSVVAGANPLNWSLGSLAGSAVTGFTIGGSAAADSIDGTNVGIGLNVAGNAGDDTLRGGAQTDVLAGGIGNDSLFGNDGADSLSGNDGDDSITGGAGNDTLAGGTGADHYFITQAGQTALNFGNDTITDFAIAQDVIDLTPVTSLHSLSDLTGISRQDGADTVIQVDALNSVRLSGVALGSLTAANFVFAASPTNTIVGTANADLLQGTPGTDTMLGLGGNDLLFGSAGNDVLDGGDGSDAALYSMSPGGIVANLTSNPVTVGTTTVAPNTVTDGFGSVDTLISIEAVIGSNSADTLLGGSAGGVTLSGGGGVDRIIGGASMDFISGGAGIDVMDGGAGFDLLAFAGDSVSFAAPGLQITVNADGTVTSLNPLLGETEANIPNFEGVLGSAGNDTITGNASDNFLAGGFGSDVIDGGAGVDTVWYFSNPGAVSLIDLGAGTSSEVFAIAVPPGFPGPPPGFTGADTLLNIENVIGTLVGDVIYGNAGNNVLEGLTGDDVLRGGAGNDTLNGGGSRLMPAVPQIQTPIALDGKDTADYATDPNSVTVNLLTGTATDGFGGTDTLISIENVTGSAFADTLSGDDGANVLSGKGGADHLFGNGGDDTLMGGAGNDVMDGGAGFDVVDFTGDPVAASAPGLTITLSGTSLTAINNVTGETDTATNVEAVRGSLGNDTMIGDATDNTFLVSGGTDTISGGLGSDTLRLESTVTVDLAAGTVQGVAGTLVLSSIENVSASVTVANADVLRGDSGANVLIGGLGDDVLVGRGGNDVLAGGISASGPSSVADGIDTADYSQDSGAVSVNLAVGTATDGSGATDTLISIERVIGSTFADTLTGDAGNNRLTGLAGNDTLTGGAGADTFLLTADAAHTPIFGNDTVTDFDVAHDVVNLHTFTSIVGYDALLTHLSQQGADVVLQIDSGNSIRLQNVSLGSLTRANFDFVDNLNIVGTNASETLTGDLGNDTIQGLDGNDNLYGLAGNDTLDGGFGVDNLYGGEGNDVLTDPDFGNMFGGPGNDSIVNGNATYSQDPSGIVVNLSLVPLDVNGNGSLIVQPRTALDGYGSTDTLGPGVTTVNASYSSDYVMGSSAPESFYLFAGNDRAYGLDGNDIFFGGSGNDFMDGGPGGFDALYYELAEDGGSAPASHGILANFSSVAANLGGVLVDPNTVIDNYGDRDTVLNFEFVVGSRFNDVIVASDTGQTTFGGEGNDTLIGGAGFDYLSGDAGVDSLDGGGNFNIAAYVGGNTGAVVDLSTGLVANDGFGYAETVRNVSAVVGGVFNDVITGDANNNSLDGGYGDDVLSGAGGSDSLSGGGGNDQLLGGDGDFDSLSGDIGSDLIDGGAGNHDSISFSANSTGTPLISGVTLDLSTQVATPYGLASVVANDGLGYTDYVRGIEDVWGTDFADTLTGGAENNMLIGRGGDDTLRGGEGSDVLSGDAGADVLDGGGGSDALYGDVGNDVMTGGAGSDSFSFSRTASDGSGATVNFGADVITDFAVGEDTLNLYQVPEFSNLDAVLSKATQNASGVLLRIDDANSIQLNGLTIADLSHVTYSFGPIVGTSGNDTLNGSSAGEFIDGLSGDDTINGLGGNDTLVGNVGNDTLNGGTGDDFLIGNVGNDVMEGGTGNDTLDGGAGNDTMTGGAGSDWFSLVPDNGSYGSDVITDFTVGEDNLNLGLSSITSSTVLLAASQQVGSDVVVHLNGTDSLTLRGMTLAQLGSANAVFAPITGTPGDDTLNGTSGADSITGLAGNDTLNGLDGNDNLSGGDGNDRLNGGAGFDSLNGGDGNDVLDGGADGDVLEGDGGNDTLTGGTGRDSFFVTAGLGGYGVDTIVDFTLADDRLYLGTVPGIAGQDDLVSLAQQVGTDVVIPLGGADSLTLQHFALADLATASVVFPAISGTAGADILTGQSGNDQLYGLGGPDTLNGLAGDDYLFGGDGDDALNGGDGQDYVSGGLGHDILNGGAGSDTLDADTGDGPINGGTGSDSFRIAAIEPGQVVITDFNPSQGDSLDFSQIASFVDRDIVNAAAAQQGSDVRIQVDATRSILIQNTTMAQFLAVNVQVAAINGTEGDDVLNGTGGANAIYGNAGSDTLNGQSGNDTLSGGGGNDTLNGGTGTDFLLGGTGDDLFVFKDGDGFDQIADFSAGDRIDLSQISSINSFADLQVAATDDGINTTIDLGGGNSLLLVGVTESQLHASDFLL